MLPLAELRSALVVRTDHIGDLVVSTPFLRALRSGLPQARITAMVAPPARDVLQGNDAVDEVITLDGALPTVELAICLAPRTKAYRLIHRTRARYRVGYVYPERFLTGLLARFWLTHRMSQPVRAFLRSGQPVPNEVEQLGKLAGFLGLDYGQPRLELPLTTADQEFGDSVARGAVALHLAAGWLTWGWTLEEIARLLGELPAPVLVTWGPAERELAQALQALAPDQKMVGDLPLKRWAAALGAARCVVSVDTGAVHVAAARGTPSVVCYQPEQYDLCSQQWAPWGVPYRALRKTGPCRPLIRKAVEELLASNRTPPTYDESRG